VEGKMSFAIVAFHFPKPEHRSEMIRRVRAAADVMAGQPGCIEAECWEETETGAIVTTGKWATQEALTAAFHAVAEAGVDFDYDERESRPRDVFRLSSV
jgi:heme-degrading monooxygenase HmoA